MKNKARILVLAPAAAIGLACSLVSASVSPTETAEPEATLAPALTNTSNSMPTETSSPAPETYQTPIPLYWRELEAKGSLKRDQITAFVTNPADPDMLYAGMQHAGVYKSVDAGKTWRPIRQGIGNATISRLLIDPSDPDTLYASTGSPQTGPGYAYKTSDGGGSWQKLPTFGPGGSLIMDGADPMHLYFQIEDRIDVSEDGGRTWKKMPALPALLWDIYAHPSAANVIFATPGPYDEGFYRSEDGGRTWKKIELNEFFLAPILVGTDPAGREVLITSAIWDAQVFKSSDGGETWEEILAGCRDLAVDRKTPVTIYCAADFQLKYSSDIGATWNTKPLPQGIMNLPGFISIGSRILVSSASGSFLSTDSGSTWKETKDGLGISRLSLQSDPVKRLLYAEDQFCNVYRSLAGDVSWGLIHRDACGLSIGFGGELFLGSYWGVIERSSNGGGTWSSLQSPWDRPEQIYAIASPRDKNRLWAISSWPEFGFFSSQDGGRTWIPVPESEAPRSGIFLFPPAPSRTIYEIGGGPGFVSEDDGETWQACERYDRHATTAILDPFNPGGIYAARRGVWLSISLDGCRSWRDVTDRLENLAVNSLAADPEHEGRIFAGTDGGVYVSFDGGLNWAATNEGLPPDPIVYSIVVDFDGRILAATPEGFYLLKER